jgi:class 3 adenylate cyclase
LEPIDSLLTTTDLAALVETGRELGAELHLSSLLQRILAKATRLTDSAASSVILFDEKRNQLYFAHATGANAEHLLENWGPSSAKGIPLTGSKAGEVFSSGRSLVINDVGQDPNHYKAIDRDTGKPTQAMVCVPMTFGAKRMGVMQILNKRHGPYSDRDVLLLENFSAQAAIAIRNARLVEDLLAHMGLYASRSAEQGPVELLEELIRPASNEWLSILFADLRGFVQLCHVVGRPELIQKHLNDFLGMLSDSVLDSRGMVNKFLGDGVMAIFRGEDHSRRAVECAARMVGNFETLRTRWDDESNVPLGFLDIGIGIATDTVIIGTIGSDRVREFTAIGTAVNLAAHLADKARDGKRILVDKMTFRAARAIIRKHDGPEAFEFKKSGQAIGHPYERYVVRQVATIDEPDESQPAPAPSAGSARRRDVFVSYSHKDRPWLEKLQIHLKPYLRSGSVSAWSDTQIRPGQRWQKEIEEALASARVALLLVSPNFLDSEFIASRELPPLLAAAGREGLSILWVPLSASSYDETELGGYQAALDPERPLDTLSPADQNLALVKLCKAVKSALEG